MIALVPSDNPSRDPIECFIATGTALILSGIAGAAATTAAAKMGSSAASHGADIESNAQKYAADLQSKANADALAFTKSQAQNAYANSESSRHGNYDQWAAAQRRLGSVGDLIGAGPREIPAYVPGVDPNFAGTPGAASPTAPPASGAPQFIAQWQQTHPVSEGVQPLLAALKAQGFNVAPFMYGATPSNNEISLDGQKYKVLGGEGGPAAYWYVPGTNDSGASPAPAPVGSAASYLAQQTPTPYAQVPIAPGLQFRNVGSYFGR